MLSDVWSVLFALLIGYVCNVLVVFIFRDPNKCGEPFILPVLLIRILAAIPFALIIAVVVAFTCGLLWMLGGQQLFVLLGLVFRGRIPPSDSEDGPGSYWYHNPKK